MYVCIGRGAHMHTYTMNRVGEGTNVSRLHRHSCSNRGRWSYRHVDQGIPVHTHTDIKVGGGVNYVDIKTPIHTAARHSCAV